MDPTDATTTQPVYVPDTGDLVDHALPDPPPAPVTDPDDPSWVEPAQDAVLVDPALMRDADAPPAPEGTYRGTAAVRGLYEVPTVSGPHRPDCTAGNTWCGEEAHCPPPYPGALPGAPYAYPRQPLPDVGTSLPQAPGDDPERDPEGHA